MVCPHNIAECAHWIKDSLPSFYRENHSECIHKELQVSLVSMSTVHCHTAKSLLQVKLSLHSKVFAHSKHFRQYFLFVNISLQSKGSEMLSV